MTTQTPDCKPRALIAMSGGVDSSVAAWLMQQAGYDCTGITMRLTRNETLGQSGFHTCCSEKDIEDAAEVAFALDIPYEVLDFTADFREQIIEKFVRVYEAGGTPNPCIDCNKYMKFRHLLDWAEAHGMEYVVTGHYARVEQDAATGRFLLKKGLDEGKDQSYVLYNLTQEQLAHIRLPLGGLHKTEVRDIAEQHKFVNARKHDSQDICFVPDGDYARFMQAFTAAQTADDLSQWRMDNCSEMVHDIYEAVKSVDKRLLFGVSPQGNMDNNYTQMYADVKKWCSEEGYLDYIAPQIYFGYENSVCPFSETLKNWENIVICKNVKLVCGLGVYKLEREDEFINDMGIIARQIGDTEADENCSGFALYSYQSLFTKTDERFLEERKEISAQLK